MNYARRGGAMGDKSTNIRRSELYKEVWTTPITQLSKKYGLSGVGLAKICKKYNAAKRNMDNDESREKIKMIHMLARDGTKWHPEDISEIGMARRSLLKMKADYTVEFVWIMSKYRACRRKDLEELVRTPSIRAVISDYSETVSKM
jgi:hypothetical protein